jgi:hypothetical protein
VSAQDILIAAAAYLVAQEAYDEAAKNCEYDRGYWLVDEQADVTNAIRGYHAALTAFVDERIDRRLAEREDGRP